eukprot:NODE_1295_length_980_cov_282.904404_g995_i0.p1 GENE.NODE_1295_length_980_cov_282.904404_g995_i0~~NODE_1295_length_980_cov_282.904404_g995_i0.p1  ORF type:complete len:281 (-),score=66.20 NODE_1295_length_980_cov_282.904404_g995_i0:137-895(-)
MAAADPHHIIVFRHEGKELSFRLHPENHSGLRLQKKIRVAFGITNEFDFVLVSANKTKYTLIDHLPIGAQLRTEHHDAYDIELIPAGSIMSPVTDQKEEEEHTPLGRQNTLNRKAIEARRMVNELVQKIQTGHEIPRESSTPYWQLAEEGEEGSDKADATPYYDLHRKQTCEQLQKVVATRNKAVERRGSSAQEVRVAHNPDAVQCVACLAHPKSVVFLPCRHMCVCHSCSKLLHLCPVCHADIASTVHALV